MRGDAARRRAAVRGTAILAGIVLSLTLPLRLVASGEAKPTPKPDDAVHTLVGEIRGINAAARSFTLKETFKGGEAKLIRFDLEDDSVILIHGQPAGLDEMQPGDSVTVKFIERAGRKIARRCDVAKPAR